MSDSVGRRTVMYLLLILSWSMTIYLLFLLNKAPFSSKNMASAYYMGCNFGSKPLTDEDIAYCEYNAEVFRRTLDDLDVQADKFYEEEIFKRDAQ